MPDIYSLGEIDDSDFIRHSQSQVDNLLTLAERSACWRLFRRPPGRQLGLLRI